VDSVARSIAPDCPLVIVTGAPGAGKSSVAAALIALDPPFLVFDADWLLADLSLLTGQQIAEREDLWPRYRRVWVTIVRMIGRNGRRVVLFIPVLPQEFDVHLPESLRERSAWCLLDCDDETRRARLQMRGWDEAAIGEAISDSRELRVHVAPRLDTGKRGADAVAAEFLTWFAPTV
jgi:hypothetical protein